MIKFSIIVPVYNTEQYLRECLDSLINQTFDNYEIIIVNDGTKDNSQKIIDEYSLKSSKIKKIIKKNGGLSDARNYGVRESDGEYLIFVDSDDYISLNMLEKLNSIIDKDESIDIVKYNFAYVNDQKEIIANKNFVFNRCSGEEAFIKLVDSKQLFEMACIYTFNKRFWLLNDFKFAKGKVHEDFGLIPLVLVKAKNVKVIDDILYYYVRHDDSITKNTSSEKMNQKAWDLLYHFDYLYLNVNNDNQINKNTKKVFNSFIANALINKSTSLSNDYFNKYILELKNRNISSFLLSNTFSRLFKKVLISANIKWYFKLFSKRGK